MHCRVLAIDDDPEATHALRRLLEAKGYTVEEQNDSSKALETAHAFRPDVVILDLLMPDVHGGDVAWQLASDPILRQAKIIICSGISIQEFTPKLPPVKIPVLEKPVDADALLRMIQSN